MRYRWLLIFFVALSASLLCGKALANTEKGTSVTILYTANTFGKKQPCPV